MNPKNVDKPVDHFANIGKVEKASMFFQIMTFILLAVAFAFYLTRSATNKTVHGMSCFDETVGAWDRMKCDTPGNPKPVILVSYDNAGKLRTVRLDDKGRIMVSP